MYSASIPPSSGSSSPPPTQEPPQRERDKIVGRAGVVALGTLGSRLLGFVRDAVIAALFRRAETDAFWVALTIPNALRQLLAEGAVSSAVVPVLSERLAHGGDPVARPFFARVRGLSLVALLAVTALGMFLSRQLAWLFASGYADTQDKLERTATATLVMFPYILLMGTAALGMAALHAKRKFAVSSFAPALFNVGIVAGALALRPWFVSRGIDPVLSLAVGVLAGGVLQVVAQWPALRAIGYASMPIIDLTDPHVRTVLRRIVPMAFGLGVYYIDLVLSRRFLSELGDGAQSYFSWASRLCDLPQGIFVMALSSAALPSLATFAATGDIEELVATWSHGMRLALFVALPCSVAMVAMGEPIVSLLFERGHFDHHASVETARALAWQGGAIFTVAATRQLVPAFHALGDTRTPVVVSACDLIAFVCLALALRGPWGHVGISCAVAGSSAVQMVLLAFALRRKLGRIDGRAIAKSAARVLCASCVAGLAGRSWVALVAGRIDHPMGRPVASASAILLFVAIFVACTWGLGASELEEVARPVVRRARSFLRPKR